MAKKQSDEIESLPDSLCFLSTGERKMLRLFVTYEKKRLAMDIPYGKTVAGIKNMVKEKFHIQNHSAQLDDENQERNRLVLSLSGADLEEQWILSDMGINPGSTIRAWIKEEWDPVVYFYVAYKDETIPVMDKIKIREFEVGSLRGLASRKSGLPVGVFRLVTKEGYEMFDVHKLDHYEIKPGDTIRIDTWDGWNDFLKLAAFGFTSHVMSKINSADKNMVHFQMKTALHMAAHFGHVELASTLIKQGVRSDEPVGEHPLRQWNSVNRHVDLRKCPVHEAVECGQLTVLKSFVLNNICCIMARDGNGLQPINIALRNKMKNCASFLLTKQWSRLPYTNSTIPLAIYARMKAWTDRARDKVQLFMGGERTANRRKPLRENPLVGQGVYIEGYSRPMLNSRSKPPNKPERMNWALKEYYRMAYGDDPEMYFKGLSNKIRQITRPKAKHKISMAHVNDQKLTLENLASKDTSAYFDVGEIGESEYNMESPDGKKVSLPVLHKSSLAARRFSKGSTVVTAGFEDYQSRPPSSSSKTAIDGELHQIRSRSEEGHKKKSLASGAASSLSASILAKAKSNDASIPLPLNSVDDTPRPQFFTRPGQPNIPRQTLSMYERHRGMSSRDYAIKCMSIAKHFDEKPWLFQVRMAMKFGEHAVKKSLRSKSRTLLLMENPS